MQKKQLRKFILLSVAFHIVLISAILLYFFAPSPTGDKSETVMVGVISSNDIAQGESARLSKTTESQPTSEEVIKPKVALEKEPAKQTIHKHKNTQKRKQTPTIKTSSTKTKSNIKEVSNSKPNSENSPDKGIESSSLSNLGKPNTGQNQAQETAGTSTKLAYPNYSLNPKPKYPRAARKRGYEGEVKLKVLVLENGKVGKIEVIRPSGYEILDTSALEAVKSWVFVPGRENGKEISSWVTVPITFQLKSG